MIRIAIVEDEPRQVDLLKSYLERYKAEKGEEFVCNSFANGLDFIEAYDNHFDIVLMDIEMNVMNGMEAAKRLRKKDGQVCLIFITNMAQYAIKGYEVDAFDFVVKPVEYFVFAMKLSKAITKIRKDVSKSIQIRNEGSFRVFSIRDIYYIESRDHILSYHTAGGVFSERNNISRLRDELRGYDFLMINSGYLVNLRYITEVRTSSIVVAGDELNVARSRKNELKKAIADYLGGGA